MTGDRIKHIRADSLKEGDLIDLTPLIEKYGDKGSTAYMVSEMEFGTVEEIVRETEGCVVVHNDICSLGLPPDEMVSVVIPGSGFIEDHFMFILC